MASGDWRVLEFFMFVSIFVLTIEKGKLSNNVARDRRRVFLETVVLAIVVFLTILFFNYPALEKDVIFPDRLPYVFFKKNRCFLPGDFLG